MGRQRNQDVGRRRRVRMLIAGTGVVALGATVGLARWAAATEMPLGGGDRGVVMVTPQVETPPVLKDAAHGDGDADDPAIWVNARRPAASLVVGALKNAGLGVFDLQGRQVQQVAAPAPPAPGHKPGRFNNVDIVHGLSLAAGRTDAAVTTDRGRDQLRIYAIDPAQAAGPAPLTDVTDPAAPLLFSANQQEVDTQRTAYGIAAFTGKDGEPYALVSREHTNRVALVHLLPAGDRVSYALVRTLDLPTTFTLPNGTQFSPCEKPGDLAQSEGLVVDAEHDVAYLSQEDIGLWRVPADLTGTPELIDKAKQFGVPAVFDPAADECVVNGADPGFGGTHLTADVEGSTIVDTGAGTGFLIVSSQGDNTYAVYDRRDPTRFLGSFGVGAGPGELDGTEQTDGLTATSIPMGPFADGLLVVQDGRNTPDVTDPAGGVIANTDFKFVDLGQLRRAMATG